MHTRNHANDSLIVVDIGNTRIKWGRCAGGVVAEVASLPASDAEAWSRQWEAWSLHDKTPWVIAGVNPPRCREFTAWLRERNAPCKALESFRDLPLTVALPAPEGIGIDRLLDTVAANARRRVDGGAIIVDAGSAVTVDYVDEAGEFRGGVIFPGFGLMAKSLHDFTALLPIVAIDANARPPGVSTIPAIQAGILAAVVGGVERVIAEYHAKDSSHCDLFITGGDGPILAANLKSPAISWPEMTLEGVRISGGG